MENSEVAQNIFTERIPKYGEVALLFFIPDNLKDRETIIELIRANGGNIVEFQECISYQLGPPENPTEYNYYPGLVYSYQWIVDSVDQGRLLEKENYILATINKGLDFPFDKKKIQYTMREIMIIYSWISGRKSQASRKTWESLGNEGLLPCRTKESLKNFWKNQRKYTLDEWLEVMTQKDLKYSHNFREPIKPHQQLPQKCKKKNKRVRNEVLEVVKDDEAETGNGDDSSANKRKIKRQVKKMENEASKTGGLEKAGVQNGSAKGEAPDMNPVTAWVEFEASEDIGLKDIEVAGINGGSKSGVAQKATKPDHPLEPDEDEDEDEDIESKKSSHGGFPQFGDDSNDEDGSGIQNNAEDLLNLFGSKD